MIKEHRKLNLQDLSNRGNDVTMEINWNEGAKDCKYIKIQMGDKEAVISKEHLWTLVFMLSDDLQQEKLLPVSQVPVTNYETILNVMARSDVKKGYPFSLPISISLNHLTNKVTIKP